MGEKVLLTDTTSHGLLPFYFGASELRQGVVRTFSPPSGSTDAPIYLLSYDVAERGSDEAGQEKLVEEIKTNSKGTHRILLDLTAGIGLGGSQDGADESDDFSAGGARHELCYQPADSGEVLPRSGGLWMGDRCNLIT